MNGNMMAVFFLFLHVACSIVVCLKIQSKRLRVKTSLIPIVILVPIWGILCVLLLHFQVLISGREETVESIEKFQDEESIYKNIFQENSEEQKAIIPLEEALLVNEPKIRRDMMMDILNSNPEEYLDLLNHARMNEDVEVVHYAATAMAELAKQYDYELQKWERNYCTEPENLQILEEYCAYLNFYIEQGMANRQMERLQRVQYCELLKKQLQKKEKLDIYIQLAENQIKLKEFADAAETLRVLEDKWSEREEYWMLKVKYFASQNLGKEMEAVFDEMKKRGIYLSAENRQKLSFWKEADDVGKTKSVSV